MDGCLELTGVAEVRLSGLGEVRLSGLGGYAEQWKSSVANTEAGKWKYGVGMSFHKNFSPNLINLLNFR